MAFTYGFYNSLNGDRRYDATQMAQIFDGIILDGVYASIGEKFLVSPMDNPTMQVIIGTGRAWFDHTWNLNDSQLVLDIPQSEVVLSRIDAVVIEVNRNVAYRENTIKVVKGTPSSNPEKPTLNTEEGVFQHPLAYLTIPPASTTIELGQIQRVVGTSECPFVTSPIEGVDIDYLFNQWSAQWDAWFKKTTSESATDFTNWMSGEKSEFVNWFTDLQNMLAGDVAANLTAQILDLQQFRKDLLYDHAIYDNITDRNGDPIRDSDDAIVQSRTIFCVKKEGPCCNEV